MSARVSAAAALANAAQLVADLKAEDVTETEAHQLMVTIRETKGWLESAEILLTPGEVL